MGVISQYNSLIIFSINLYSGFPKLFMNPRGTIWTKFEKPVEKELSALRFQFTPDIIEWVGILTDILFVSFLNRIKGTSQVGGMRRFKHLTAALEASLIKLKGGDADRVRSKRPYFSSCVDSDSFLFGVADTSCSSVMATDLEEIITRYMVKGLKDVLRGGTDLWKKPPNILSLRLCSYLVWGYSYRIAYYGMVGYLACEVGFKMPSQLPPSSFSGHTPFLVPLSALLPGPEGCPFKDHCLLSHVLCNIWSQLHAIGSSPHVSFRRIVLRSTFFLRSTHSTSLLTALHFVSLSSITSTMLSGVISPIFSINMFLSSCHLMQWQNVCSASSLISSK